MKQNRLIQRILAIILLLVFAQKNGVELYLHNWLHAGNSRPSPPLTHGNNVVSYNCHCIDDFSMPFTGSAEKISYVASLEEFDFPFLDRSITPIPSTFFFSLRAPPSFS